MSQRQRQLENSFRFFLLSLLLVARCVLPGLGNVSLSNKSYYEFVFPFEMQRERTLAVFGCCCVKHFVTVNYFSPLWLGRRSGDRHKQR